MATGYTYPVCEGDITFTEFALSCARAMGACIMQRDDPSDVSPNLDEKVDDYYRTSVEDDERELAELKAMTQDEIDRGFYKYLTDRKASYESSLAETKVKVTRLKRMLKLVEGWKPPTPDHENYKKFMVSQLTETLDWEDRPPYDKPEDALKTAGEWYKIQLDCAERSLKRSRESYAEAVKSVTARNKWKRELIESIKAYDTPGRRKLKV